MSEVEKHGFQTEVKQLLGLLANSLYSNKEVFLRELISNASDAIDKLRFISLGKPEVLAGDAEFRIRVSADRDKKTLTVSDNGLGMTRDEAVSHLGTIAKSGTADFLRNLTGDQARDSQLIGQFGVGFYSAFVVADKVTVISRSYQAGADEAVCWESDGSGEFEVSTVTKADRGTDVILTLRDGEGEFLEDWTLRSNISKYSDHISVPVQMLETVRPEGDDADKKDAEYTEWKQVNDAKALWTRNPSDISDDEYKEFYKHVSHDYEDPLTWTHNHVEGTQEYTSLMFIPKRAPWDLFNREQKHGLKLYVQRVFIMDDADEFMPGYLRFVKGVLDSNDLPLNVSREILQNNRISAQLKKACTKKALQMIAKLAKDEDKTRYATFWSQFGSVLKEGVVEDYDNREEIFGLLRYASTNGGETPDVSLDDYISRMPEKQKNIYYITAESYRAAASSPYIETLKKKGVEVLLMWERVDEWVMSQTYEYKEKKFVNVCSPDLDLGELEDQAEKDEHEAKAAENKDLLERIGKALGDRVSEVKVSGRLVDTPSCVIGDSGVALTAQMRRLLEASGQKLPEEKFVLEINPDHELIRRMSAETDDAKFADWAELILDQALLADQRGLKDPVAYVKLVNSLLLA